jgi:hypothetical protein
MVKKTEEDEYEISAEKFGELITELLEAKENLNKLYTTLRKKI